MCLAISFLSSTFIYLYKCCVLIIHMLEMSKCVCQFAFADGWLSSLWKRFVQPLMYFFICKTKFPQTKLTDCLFILNTFGFYCPKSCIIQALNTRHILNDNALINGYIAHFFIVMVFKIGTKYTRGTVKLID